MTYLLDTNICIYLLNGRYPQVEQRLMQCEPDEVVLSAVVVAELMFGAANSQKPQQNFATLDLFLPAFQVQEFGMREARAYGEIRAYLKGQGHPIGSEDTFIVAHARANDLILVTNNTKQFQHVPGLRLDNWVVMDNDDDDS